MRISVEHSNCAVSLEPHTFRLRPRTNGAQRLLTFEIQIAPVPVGTTECLDQDGNLALHAWFDSPTQELRVLSRFEIEMLRNNPFDFILGSESLQLPLSYSELLGVALDPYRSYGQVAGAVKQYAHSVAAGAQWNSLAFLADLNRQLFQSCNHVTRPEGPPWPSELTLRLREGSCRDLAVLFCDLCRVVGIAARFVSGYECAAAGGEDSYMHAWAEAYLPGAGWRGYDPSRGLVVANAHVAVAAGLDYELASPVAGLYRGASVSHMDASIRMHVNPGSTP